MKAKSRVLWLDLSTGKHDVEEIDGRMVVDFIGGRGIASMIVSRDLPSDVDPLSPENIIAIAPGVLVGTIAPTAGRTTIVFKSPATGMFFKTNMGGEWGAELRYAGYDLIALRGKAAHPSYILITDNMIEMRDASKYWGLDVLETVQQVCKDAKLPRLSVSCIGPAGERGVKYAAFMSSSSAAGRGGLGAVFGSKNIKAIAVSGNTPLEVADVIAFNEECTRVRNAIAVDPRCHYYGNYGTAGGVIGTNEANALPSYNFREGCVADAYSISGQCLTECGYLVRRESCFACTIACKRHTRTKERYLGIETIGPEYESIAALGSCCGVTDMDTILKANAMCNLYGLDTISTGVAISWAMECFEKGLIKPSDVEGLRLEWGDSAAVITLIKMIAFRQGLGDILAEGVRIAAKIIGGDSWKWAIEAKGLEQAGTDTRVAKAYALAFATNPRGPDHLYGQPMAEYGITPEARAVVKKITGSDKYADPIINSKKPEIVEWHENVFAITDCLGLCSRATLSTYAVTPEMMARMYSTALGVKVDGDDMFEAAKRIINVERCLTIRNGGGRSHDTLPWRLMNEERQTPRGLQVNSHEELDGMLDHYYEIRGWEKASGWPKSETLKEMGLDKEIEQLEKLGRCNNDGKN